MRQTPEIVTGHRGPEVSGVALAIAEALKAEPAPTQRVNSGLPAGAVEFHSVAGSYFLQLTAPADRFDPSTGITHKVRPLSLKFREGRVITRDVEIIHRCKGCPEECGQHKDPYGNRCEPHPHYGLGRDFWDASEALAAARDKQIKTAVATVKANPEVLDLLLKELGAEDFDLESHKAAKSENKSEKPKKE